MSVNSGETVTVREGTPADRASWRVSPGAVIAVATVVAFGVRLFTLTRPGFLTQPTEYDDGVYLGGAIRLTQGVLPYKDFAFVQPPGILLLMTPAALFARATSTVAGLALVRVLTLLASTACVALAGRLVRHRGTLVTMLTCFILAIYPPDIASAHTLLLEPWMNLLCLLGATAAFRDGRLAIRPARLAWAGIAIGFACTVKFWSGVPALVLLVLLLADRPAQTWRRRLVAYVAGLAGGFVVPLLPFLVTGPGTFLRSTIVYQAARVGTYTPMSLRLAHITGLGDVLGYAGNLTLGTDSNSLFAQSVVADTAPATTHWLPFLAFAILVAVVVAGYLMLRDRTPLDWFALAVAALALIAILSYSAFFYHYPAFPAPWLAIMAGIAVGGIMRRLHVPIYQIVAGGIATIIAGAAILQLTQVAQLKLPAGADEFASRIPPGACVVTDEISLTVSANRFESAKPGCPVVLDALATTLVFTHGVSVQGGAARDARAVADWQALLSKADYVWLSPNVWRRLPWHDGYAPAWFYQHFTQIWPAQGWVRGLGNLYERR